MNEAMRSGCKAACCRGGNGRDFLLPETRARLHAARLVGGEIEALHAAKKAAEPPSVDRMNGVEFIPVTYFIQARRVRPGWSSG